MTKIDLEKLGGHIENWVLSAPTANDLEGVTLDAHSALIEAGMVQHNPNGWDFKLHEKYPEAPKAQFKLMIRKAPGVNTDPAYYDRFTLPSVLQAGEEGTLEGVRYIVGYPNAGIPIARSFVHLAAVHLGIELKQLQQNKIIHGDGKRQLGEIQGELTPEELTKAADDTATGGDTKIEGWQRILERKLRYAGLILLVERDPLASALIRERTGSIVSASMHWLTIVQLAGRAFNLPEAAIRREMDYPLRLFEWNATHGNLGRIPTLSY